MDDPYYLITYTWKTPMGYSYENIVIECSPEEWLLRTMETGLVIKKKEPSLILLYAIPITEKYFRALIEAGL